jgi:C4-dicarboxylate-specific signal transduction histidine kinase
LSASIAHELSQPLAAITANGHASLRWLAREVPDLEEVQTAIERMLKDAIRAGEVLHRIRAFSTKGTPAQHVSLDLNEVIRDALTLMQDELLAHRVSLCTELSPGLSPVPGDRVQLQQVFLNLIRNGVEAMDTVTERPRELRIRCCGDNAHEVLVTVQDSGIGLDPDQETRLFDTFFTTKSQGMGLGLSISRRIIEGHGGRLWAASGDGFGSTFHCALPIENQSGQG